MGDYKLILGYPGNVDGWGDTDTGSGYTHELDLLTGLSPANESTASPWATGVYGRVDWAAMAAYSARVADNVMLFNLKGKFISRNLYQPV